MKTKEAPVKLTREVKQASLCSVCQFNELPCRPCRKKLGVTKEWAARFLGFQAWRETCPTSKRDREYLINAAIKAQNEAARRANSYITSAGQYWMSVAKDELLND